MTDSQDLSVFQDGLISVHDACLFLGLKKSKIYDLMARGELRYCQIGRARRVPKSELLRLAAATLRGGWSMSPCGLIE